ncbi:MAG: shikimate kinase [Nitrospinota bacterium]
MKSRSKVLIITGFKSTGKSTVGKIVANRLNLPFIDTDRVVEQLYFDRYSKRKSFREIYNIIGDTKFRKLEADAIKGTLDGDGEVVSLGGGGLETLLSLKLPVGDYIIVELVVAKDILYKRIMRRGIPLFLDKEDSRGSFEQLYRDRSAIYEAHATLRVNNYNIPAEVTADNIVKHYLEHVAN